LGFNQWEAQATQIAGGACDTGATEIICALKMRDEQLHERYPELKLLGPKPIDAEGGYPKDKSKTSSCRLFILPPKGTASQSINEPSPIAVAAAQPAH